MFTPVRSKLPNSAKLVLCFEKYDQKRQHDTEVDRLPKVFVCKYLKKYGKQRNRDRKIYDSFEDELR